MPQPPGLVIVAVPLAPCAAADTVAVQFVSHVLLAAVQLLPARVVTDHVSLTPPIVTVAVSAVLTDALDVNRTAIVCPGVIVPDVPHVPPLIDICGLPEPVTLTAAPASYPVGVIAVEAESVDRFTPVRSVKLKAFGVVSAARVVTLQLSVTVPTVTVVLTAVENDALEVRRTSRVCPFVIVPDVTQLPPLMRKLAPPVAETLVAVLMPLIVTLLDAVSVLGSAPVTSVKVKASGVVSQAVCCVQLPLE